ncbi:MAG: nitrogen fixation negative regulator NifL [Methylococcaceae bacterium]
MKKTSLHHLRAHVLKENALNELNTGNLTVDFQDDDAFYALFIEAVEQAPVAISITDKKANILYVNQEFTRVTGYTPADILGKNESVLSNKATPRTQYRELWHTIGNKKIWRGILCNRHRQGQPYLADLTIAPMLNEQNKISHYIGMHRDVTETYQAEKNITNQKTLIESVINASPIAMVVVDAQQRVILDNHKYKALVSDLGKGEPAHYFLSLLQQEIPDLWENRQSFNQREFRVESKGLQRIKWFACCGNWFIENDIHADAFFEPEQKYYLVLTISDITKQRRQLEELHIQALKIVMSEDERVRGIRETLLGAIHQIAVPMNQITAAEQILRYKKDNQHSNLLQLLQQIQQSGESAITTMQNCIPEIVQSAVIPVNLNHILHEVMLLSESLFNSADIEVQWQPLLNLPTILGSENRLRILFKQLVDNAVEAMQRADTNERLLTISTYAQADLCYVSISDTGMGIPNDKRAKVFEPFYTTQPMGGKQAGMGLVMVKEIINQHQGFIEIDSEYHGGCRFKISFPMHKSSRGLSQ